MKALKITAVVVAVLVAAVFVFVAFFLPDLAKDIAMKQIRDNTGRTVVIEDVEINPFGMTAVMNGTKLLEPDNKTVFVGFSSVRASVSMKTLWRRAIILDKAEVRSPYVNVVRVAPNRYNFTDILEHMEERKKKEPEKEKKETKFSINNISLTGGTVIFKDKAVEPQTTHTIRQMQLYVPFVSTMPYMSEKYITPSFSALVNNAPLKVEGKLRPFAERVEAAVDLKLQNARIPFYHSYFPGELPVKVESGRISTDAEIVYTAYKKEKPTLVIAGNLWLLDLFLRDRLNEPLFVLKKGETGLRSFHLLKKEMNFNVINLDGFEVYLSRDKKGIWNHSRLKMAAKETEKKAEEKGKAEPGKPMLARAAITTVRNGTLHYVDEAVGTGFKMDVRNIAFDLGGYTTQENVNAPFRISFETSTGVKTKASGSLQPKPLFFDSFVALNGFRLQDYYPLLSDKLVKPVKGEVDLSGHVVFQKKGGLDADNVNVDIRKVAVDFAPGEFARIAAVKIRDAAYDDRKKSLYVDNVIMNTGDVRMSRDKAGKFSPLKLVKEGKKAGASVKTEKGKGPLFKYHVKDFSVNDFHVAFRDATLPEQPKFDVNRLNLAVANIKGPTMEAMPYRIDTRYGKKGRVEASGSIRPKPLHFTTKAKTSQIPLKDFGPYISKNLNLAIVDGNLDSSVRADIRSVKDKINGTFGGDLSISSFQARDPVAKTELLAWQNVRAENVDGRIDPLKVSIENLVLTEYYANVVILKDGKLNFAQLAKKEGKPEEKKPEKPGPPPDITIRNITLQNGVVAFEDRHLDPRLYATRVVKLTGRVSGISADPKVRGEVDLRGALENHSPIRITGQMNPIAQPMYVNIRVDFDNIELPRLTPYSATYLGYRIDQGKLHTDLNYRIENNRIDAVNHILIDQLFFGQKVDSDKATNLPVPAAVGLLKDRKGQINLEVPVTGTTDDPNFSFRDAVRQAFKGTFAKIFKNPFAFLGKGAEEFRNVYFPYGAAKLTDEAKGRLASFAKLLDERPGLDLDVTGYVDKEKDAEALRHYLVGEKVRYEKFIETVKGPERVPPGGQIPDNIQVGKEEYSKYLKRAYNRATFPKPKKELSDDEMRKLMLSHTVVGDAELRELSRNRSLAVRDFLAAKGKITQARLFLRMGDIYREPEEPVKTKARVEFGLATSKRK